jgi:hypothetical protein
MKKIILITLLILSNICFSQDKYENIAFENLLKLKIDEDRFQFGWLYDVFSEIPCFRDYTKNAMQMQLVDPKTDSIFYKSEEPKRNGIKIVPSKILLDKQNKKLKIQGKLTGGWESIIPFEYEIYVGQKNDIISEIKLSPDLHGDIYYNGEKVDKTIVVDRVPAFYLSNHKKFEAFRGEKNQENSTYKEVLFDIETEFDEKSILVFGLSSRYAEIFEIGKLLTE